MYKCHECNLYGGFKGAEKKLGISRSSNVNGKRAVQLWNQYKRYGNKKALKDLKGYNKEDVLNLAELRKKLGHKKHRSKSGKHSVMKKC